jgi:RNA polymerase sigma-70 factor (ECF subfamily)
MTDFETFFRESYDRVRRSIALLSSDDDAATEATQEAFARAYARWDRLADIVAPIGWVYVVATNELRSRARKQSRALHALPSVALPGNATDVDPTIVVEVRRALERLSPRERTAVLLYFYEDLSVDETARHMRCRPGTVKATLSHARDKLRVSLSWLIDEGAGHAEQ